MNIPCPEQLDVGREDILQVQMSYKKRPYRTRFTSYGHFTWAATNYNSLNVGLGYNKRLLLNGKTIARERTNV